MLMDFEAWSKNKQVKSTLTKGLTDKAWSDLVAFTSNPEHGGLKTAAMRAVAQCHEWGEHKTGLATCHVFLSLYSLPVRTMVEEEILEEYVNPIRDVAKLLPRATIITINDDPRLNGMPANSPMNKIAINFIAMELRASGYVVFTSSLLWARTCHLFDGKAPHRVHADSMYSMVASFDKFPMREKLLTACMLRQPLLEECEENIEAYNTTGTEQAQFVFAPRESELKLAWDIPDQAEAQEERDRTMARTLEMTAEVGPEGPTWHEMDVSLVTPEPYYDRETYWINLKAESYNSREVQKGKFYVCTECEMELGRPLTGAIQEGQRSHYCPCCANKAMWKRDYRCRSWSEVSDMERKAEACARYAYLNDFKDENGAFIIPKHDLKEYVRYCSRLAYKEYGKTISSCSALRLSKNQAVEYTELGKARCLSWNLAMTQDHITCVMPMYDPGNAAYAGHMKCLFSDEEIREMFYDNANPPAEILGDVFEIAIGMMAMALRNPDLYKRWGHANDHLSCLRGLERSFYRYAAAESISIMAIENRKRRPPKNNSAEEEAAIRKLSETMPGGYYAVLTERDPLPTKKRDKFHTERRLS